MRRNNRYYIGDHSVFGLTTKAKLYIDDKEDHYFHIYYDSRRAESQRVDSLDMIDKLEREFDGKRAKKTAVEGELLRFKKYFKLRFDNNRYFMSYKCDDKAIDAITDQFGFLVIVTTEEMSASKAIDVYRDRDGVEKVFRALKSELGCATFGVHSTASLKAKVQLSFIASIVRNRIFQRLKSSVGKDRKTNTVNASMNIAENIEISKNSEGVYVRRYSLNAKQKKVLDAFGLNEDNLNSWISKHATKLSKEV